MKLFRIVVKNFARLGMSPHESRFNRKSAIVFFFFSVALLCASVFFFFMSKDFIEYTLNTFVTITIFTGWINYIVMLLQKDQLFELIDDFEAYADESEYQKWMKNIFLMFWGLFFLYPEQMNG